MRLLYSGENKGGQFMTETPWDPNIEQMSLKDLKELQLKRLRKMLDYVYRNNRFYRDRLKDAKVNSDNLKSLKEKYIC